jgi:hypothetical protein
MRYGRKKLNWEVYAGGHKIYCADCDYFEALERAEMLAKETPFAITSITKETYEARTRNNNAK